MSGWFIATLVLLAIALVFLAYGLFGAASGVPFKAGLGIIALIPILLLLSSITTIPTRTVGVVTSFGRPTEALSNGWHWIVPWAKVEKFDASIQTLKLDAAGRDCVTVRLANQTTACVDVSVQWNVDSGADVIDLYKRYRTFDNIETNLVHRQLQRALNVAFEAYDPLRAVNGTSDSSGQTLDQLAGKAEATLRLAVGGGVAVQNVTIPLVHYDATTEERLKAYQQALADTRIAEQRKATAQKVAEANGILAGSASTHDSGVEYQNCLDMVERTAKASGSLPAGFSCGASAAVVVGAK